ncbi:MAG: TatD family hydrolase [Elusimicrobiota bacterium]
MADIVYADTHTHLSDDSFDNDRQFVISSCAGLNIKIFFEVLCAPLDWDRDVLFSSYADNFYFAYGIHPEYASQSAIADLSKLELKLKGKKSIFIGEIGLDYYWVNDNKEKQKELLLSQLALSEKLFMPCVFHCRNGKEPSDNAYEDLLDLLEKNWKYSKSSGKRGVLHSFSGTQKDAVRAIELGLFLGVNGTFTYPKNGYLREIVKKAGIENIVLETDCPYLPLQSSRGKRNTPLSIPEISAEIASFCSLSPTKTAETLYDNSISFIK